jgi:hypothetical protein
MILDNFKNARHIISVMKYLNVDQASHLSVTSNGGLQNSFNHQNQCLIAASFLTILVTIMNLPFGLDKHASSHKQSWFLPIEKSESLDVKLIIMSALLMLHSGLCKMQISRGISLYRNLRKTSHQLISVFFEKTRLFDKHNNSQWPFYIFALRS